jgi:hypothetical protein
VRKKLTYYKINRLHEQVLDLDELYLWSCVYGHANKAINVLEMLCQYCQRTCKQVPVHVEGSFK